jgi:hypothetical protein
MCDSAATFLGVSVLAAVGYLVALRLLDRSRLRRWEAGWVVVERMWWCKVP